MNLFCAVENFAFNTSVPSENTSHNSEPSVGVLYGDFHSGAPNLPLLPHVKPFPVYGKSPVTSGSLGTVKLGFGVLYLITPKLPSDKLNCVPG